MSVFSKLYGYPTGYFNTIYKYLLNDGQIKTEKDLIKLVKDFGYPPSIVEKLSQEIICSDGLNLPDVVENWDNDLQLDKEPDEDVEMDYQKIVGGDNDNNIQDDQSDEIISSDESNNSNSSSETDELNSDSD